MKDYKHQKIIDRLTYCRLTGGFSCIACICPYCNRKMPNRNWLKGKGCKWCQKL